jgi:hypothetical protein
MQTFEDRFGVAADVRSWLYADAWLRHAPHRVNRRGRLVPLAPPAVPFFYREPGLHLPLSLAVAIDSTLSGQNNSAATDHLSFSFTNAAGNFVLICANVASGHTFTAAATYGGSNATLLTNLLTGNASSYNLYVWYVFSAATGANTVFLQADSTANIDCGVISFSGAHTSAFPDNSFATASNQTTSPMTATGTTVTNGAWPVAVAGQNGTFIGAGSGVTREIFMANTGETGLFDNAAPLASAGSFSIPMTNISVASGWISFAIRPAGGGAAPFGPECFQPISQPTHHRHISIVTV